MQTIWKIELTAGSGAATLPKGAKPLSIHLQNGSPQMWLMVDPDQELEQRHFHIAGTGHELPDNLGDFIGTFLVQNDTLVFHVFELKI